jgi:hypothetical protein
MPVFNKKPSELFNDFVDYINRILNKTITRYRLCWSKYYSNIKARMFFPSLQKIQIKNSPFLFTITQTLFANIDHGVKDFAGQYRLETHEYQYYIWKNDESGPIIRFDYEKRLKEEATHCRHHCHMLIQKWGLDFDQIHVPTGWVLIEDFIRFIIVDLKCPTLSSESECFAELNKSEETFFKNRSSKEINPQNLITQ